MVPCSSSGRREAAEMADSKILFMALDYRIPGQLATCCRTSGEVQASLRPALWGRRQRRRVRRAVTDNLAKVAIIRRRVHPSDPIPRISI